MQRPVGKEEVARVLARPLVEYLSHYVPPIDVGTYFHCTSTRHLVRNNNTEDETLQVKGHGTIVGQWRAVVTWFPAGHLRWKPWPR